MLQQRTLKQSITLSGVGVHSGQVTQITLKPAGPNTGIVFRRTDVDPVVDIPAHTQFVGDTRLNTSLMRDGCSVSTIEHLMSAFAGLGIDNAYVDLQSAEIPIMDGSSKNFITSLQQAGIEEQGADKLFIRIKKSVEVVEQDKVVRIEPFDGIKYSMAIQFDHPAIRNTQQNLSIELTPQIYIDEISAARTFGFLSEYEFMKQKKLAQGASLENTVVLDDNKVINDGGLRYPDEFVKHKLLDAIGDMYLLGKPFIGAFYGYKSGHQLNHALRTALLADQDAWELVTREN